MNEPKDPEAAEPVQTTSDQAVAPVAFCSALASMRDYAMAGRFAAIESGSDGREQYFRGALDAIHKLMDVASGWRNPQTDPPTQTGKILVWCDGGPAIVNVEERWMCFWNGHDETEATDPSEWIAWCAISEPNYQSQAAQSAPQDEKY